MNLIESIGKTDLVEIEIQGQKIYGKLEKQNPGGSIKDRPALFMIQDALAQGRLREGMTIVEPTSGNMGIALAMIGSHLGFAVQLVMPASMSVERRRLMEALGAQLVLTEEGGMEGAVARAQEMAQDPLVFMPAQFENPANKKAHRETTGPEILAQCPDLAGFACGIGTGGTVSGVAEALVEAGRDLPVWGLEPAESPLLTQGQAASHQIQGIGANFVPAILRQDLLDRVLAIPGQEALAMTRYLAREKGLLVGISSGANVLGALALAREVGGPVVTVLPDGLDRYLSTEVFA